MNEKKENILILGGGQTACYAASEIRKYNTKSIISIISNERQLPYERPPLSKDCLLNKMEYDDCSFFNRDFYAKNEINFYSEELVEGVDFKSQKIDTSKRKKISYDKLLIALGSSNKKSNKNYYHLRSMDESRAIKEKMLTSENILIVGGGFIGLELASAANQLKKNVCVVEMGSQLMGRIVPEKIAKIVQQKHEGKGVVINLNTKVLNVIKNQNFYEVELSNNKIIKCDMIIAGIGSEPNTALFMGTDLKIDNGILVNEFCETSVENVYAAGDVANFYHPFYKKHIRLESWKHAQNHGVCAGKNIIEKKETYKEIPWMWSDQFDLNLQLTGLCQDYDTFVERGASAKEGLIHFFIKNRKIIGACGIGVGGKIGRDVKLASKISEKNIKVTKEILSNIDFKLNKLLTQ
jgi:3-phenylpropionate/trans-cinnamate dioxygenase ferredoxin reductase component|tara:strand:+ start:1370 stop:2593 length:1224 start_codon:yes stop_codon:yes gene_type:complete